MTVKASRALATAPARRGCEPALEQEAEPVPDPGDPAERRAGALAEPALVDIARAADVPPADWEPLMRRGFHLRGWFEAAEDTGHFAPRHVAVQAGGEIKALVPAYLESSALHGDLHHRWLGPLRGLFHAVGIRLRPTLVVCPPLGNNSQPLGDSADLTESTLERVFHHLEERAWSDRAKAVVWPFVSPDAVAILGVARRRGYAEVFTGSRAVLSLSGASFEDYVAARRKKVRRTIRTELRALAESDVSTLATADFRDAADRMDALYRRAFRRRNGREPDLDPAFFHRLAGHGTADVRAQLSWRGDRLVGMNVMLIAGETLDLTLAAYAPEVAGVPVYFNDSIYRPVRLALDAGIHRIDLGPSSLYPKVLRGCRLESRVSLVRGRTPALHATLRGWGLLVSARVHQKERRDLGPLALPEAGA